MDIKRVINLERKLQKDDKEIYENIKPFAHLLSKDQYQDFFEGLVLEKNLKLRLSQLKAYRYLFYLNLLENSV